MSIRNLVEQLTEVLDREADAFEATEHAMQSDREAFVALRTSDVEKRFPSLLDLAEKSVGIAHRREELQLAIAEQLGVTGEFTMTSLRPHVPGDLQSRLDGAASRARRAATRVKVETRVSEKLLALSRRWRAAMLGLPGDFDHRETTGYDRRARAAHAQSTSGSLVRGTL